MLSNILMYFCFYVSLCFAYLGPTGVGLNELKRKLLISDPQHFSVTIPRKSLLICVCVFVTVWDWFINFFCHTHHSTVDYLCDSDSLTSWVYHSSTWHIPLSRAAVPIPSLQHPETHNLGKYTKEDIFGTYK